MYNLEDDQIPDQVRHRRQEILTGEMISPSASIQPSITSIQENVYKPTVLPNDIVYIEVDSDVDPFLNRLEVRVDCVFLFLNDPVLFFEVFSMYSGFAFAIRWF